MPACSLRRVEGEEVGALPPLHVDHLDVLARAHLVGERRWRGRRGSRAAGRRAAPAVRARARPRRGGAAEPRAAGPRPGHRPRPRACRPGRRRPRPPRARAERLLRTRSRRRPEELDGLGARGSSPRAASGTITPEVPSPRDPTSAEHRRRSRGAATSSAAKSSRPSGPRTVSSARWPPSTSRTVSRSSGCSATTVTAPRPHPVGLPRRVGAGRAPGRAVVVALCVDTSRLAPAPSPPAPRPRRAAARPARACRPRRASSPRSRPPGGCSDWFQ